MADRPLRPATRRCLGEPLPHQLADRPRDPPEAPEHFLTWPCDPVGISGISPSFLGLFQSSGQVSHVLLTRSPLTHVTRRSSAFDLHVLGPPPAFVLSQDQTLRRNLRPTPPKRCWPSNQLVRHHPKAVPTRVRGRSGHQIPADQAQVNGGRPKPATAVRTVLFELFRVCPVTTRDRLWTARTGFFVLYPVFKEHLEARGLPAHDEHAGRIPCDGGGALNPPR